ncbi:hypothetical protein Dimus_038655 [Dionaea muscipula]
MAVETDDVISLWCEKSKTKPLAMLNTVALRVPMTVKSDGVMYPCGARKSKAKRLAILNTAMYPYGARKSKAKPLAILDTHGVKFETDGAMCFYHRHRINTHGVSYPRSCSTP